MAPRPAPPPGCHRFRGSLHLQGGSDFGGGQWGRRTAGIRRPTQRKTATTYPSYLRTAQLAEILYVSPKTVSRWAKEGKLPFLKTLGGHRRYPASEIRQLAAELQVQPTA